jgi:hypothetical protein
METATRLPVRWVWEAGIVGVLFVGWLGASLLYHATVPAFSARGEFYSDKIEYNLYLPALFIYRFDAQQFPKGLEYQVERMHILNRKTGRVQTRFAYGVALLQAPFWLVAHALAEDKSGFSRPYRQAVNAAGVFYAVLGLWFTFWLLRRWFSDRTALWATAGTALGTNLFYYGVIEPGFSHAFSFFAVSVLLYCVARAFEVPGQVRATYWAWASLALALVFAIRQVNVLFAAPLVLAGCTSWRAVGQRVRLLLAEGRWAVPLATLVLLTVPQVLYYLYLTGRPVAYSYGTHEGFPYLLRPHLLSVWFAPENGLFLYTPLLLLAVGGMGWMIGRGNWTGGLTAAVFLGVSYLYGSWWDPVLGCSFGYRGLTDYLALWAVPMAFVLHQWRQRRAGTWLTILVLAVGISWNLKLTDSYSGCFNDETWNWPKYGELLSRPPRFWDKLGRF